MNCKKILSFAVAMAMTATLSAVNTFAEDVKETTIILNGDFSETMNFEDITLPERVEGKEVYLSSEKYGKNFTMKKNEDGAYVTDEVWSIDLNDEAVRADIIATIGDEEINEDSLVIENIQVTAIHSFNRDITGSSMETQDPAQVYIRANAVGNDEDGEWIENDDETVISLSKDIMNQTIHALEVNASIVNYGGMSIDPYTAFVSPESATGFNFRIEDIKLTVSYAKGEEDTWRGLGWHMAAHSPEEDEGDRSADIAAAILKKEPELAELGHTIRHWDYAITDITVDYTVTVFSSMAEEDVVFEVSPYVGGMAENGSEEFIETAFEETVFSVVEGTKEYVGTVSAKEVLSDENNSGAKSINNIHVMDIYVGMGASSTEDEILLTIDTITIDLKYVKPVGTPPLIEPISYDDVNDADRINVICEAAKIGRCGHEDHINEGTGVDEAKGKEYCPWVDASFHFLDENGELGWPAYVMDYSKGKFNADGSEVAFVFDLDEVQNEIGAFDSEVNYAIAAWQSTSLDYEIKDDSSSSGGSSSGGSSSSGSSSSSSSSSTTEPEKTEEKVDVKEETAKIAKAEKGEKVEVKIEGTVVPKDYIESAKESKATVVVDYGSYAWEISDVKNVSGSVDLSIDTNAADMVHIDALRKIEGDNSNIIDIKHNGELGFKGTLKYNVDKKNAGKFVNRYYYNIETGELELQGSTKIDEKGFVHLPFTHCSTYVLNITSDPATSTLFEDLSAGESATVVEGTLPTSINDSAVTDAPATTDAAANPETGNSAAALMAIPMVVAAAAVISKKR
ncbi:MAG: hypothetical protein IKK32_04805 [Oscillospiraceae bacterium]|nr:hypothetical protein [Oscillospiraceae bacterium]